MPRVALQPGTGGSASATRAFLLLSVALVAAAGLVGCARDGGGPMKPAPPGQQLGTAQSTTAPPTTATASASASASPELADGEHYAYITSVKVGSARTITLDLIDFLTGAEANKACVAHKAPECPPPNDYFIVNDNPKLRTMPVSATVTVKVLASMGSTDQISITFDQIPAHFSGTMTAKQLSPLPFRLKVAGGVIVAVEEIFLP